MSVEEKIELFLKIANDVLKSEKWKVIKNYREFAYDTWWLFYDDYPFGFVSDIDKTTGKEIIKRFMKDRIVSELIKLKIIDIVCKLDKKEII